MTFEYRPARSIDAVRSLLIALAGSSGSGKTFSALRIATGLVEGTGKRIRFIDTEGGRGLHYRDQFDYDYAELQAPFRPQAYQDAIAAAENDPATGVIVVDSLSHEWEGEGGILEWADEILLSAGTWPDGNPKMKPPAQWKEPKQAHKRFMARMLQCRAHLIFCLRAEEKMLMETQTDEQTGRKKTVVVAAKDRPLHERWQPICEKRFMYEMTASFLMLDKTSGGTPGVPVPLKLQEQHKGAFPDGKHISEASGKVLAEWAGGGHPTAGASRPASASEGATPRSEADSAPAAGPSPDNGPDTTPRWILGNGQEQSIDTIADWERTIAQRIEQATPEQAAEAERRNNQVMRDMAIDESQFAAVVRVRDLFRQKTGMDAPA